MIRDELIAAVARKVRPNAFNEKQDKFRLEWREKIIAKAGGIVSMIEAELKLPVKAVPCIG